MKGLSLSNIDDCLMGPLFIHTGQILSRCTAHLILAAAGRDGLSRALRKQEEGSSFESRSRSSYRSGVILRSDLVRLGRPPPRHDPLDQCLLTKRWNCEKLRKNDTDQPSAVTKHQTILVLSNLS